jgi:hypothetical protein
MRTKSYAQHERYVEICKKMELLGIKDVSTTRQTKNGTRVWQLPIKLQAAGNHHITGKPFPDRYIQVASFKTGYVRNQNGGYTNYQLNKRCESEPQYYKCTNKHDGSDLYRKYTTRTCKLIPNEIDRLEYLIAYCLKNYYIKNANQVAEGSYVSKWYHEYELERNQNKMEKICHLDANAPARISDLECKIIDLKAQLHMLQEELSGTKVRQDVSVIVNGHRYKVL